jgi:hypothetical protein
MIYYEEIPHCAYPVFDVPPDMCLKEELEKEGKEKSFYPAILEKGHFPPRLEITEAFNITDIKTCLKSPEGIQATNKVSKVISDMANCYIEAGMKTVIVNFYGNYAFSNEEGKALFVENFSMVAYNDEIEYEGYIDKSMPDES